MFVRICPYLPFSARICLNQHHWLANRMGEQDIAFKQTANAFLKCAATDRLQELANSLTPRDLVTCGHALCPPYRDSEPSFAYQKTFAMCLFQILSTAY
jgi:hypothetical protein